MSPALLRDFLKKNPGASKVPCPDQGRNSEKICLGKVSDRESSLEDRREEEV